MVPQGNYTSSFRPVINLEDTGMGTIRRHLPQDGNPVSHMSLPLPPPPPPTQTVYVIDEAGPNLGPVIRVVGLLIAFVLGAIAYIHFTGEHEDPLDNLMAFIDHILMPTGPAVEIGTAPAEKAVAAAKPEAAPEEELLQPKFDPTMVPNPYWMLPNDLPAKPTDLGMQWDAAERDRIKSMFNHQFIYQHLVAVKEIRAKRYNGAQGLLFEALNEQKFWTRMEAAFALAEFGHILDVDVIDGVLKGTRPALIANYFKRLIRRQTPGERFVVRQALRLVDAPARLHILQGLSRAKAENRLYLAAAVYDPSPLVQGWLQEEFNGRPVNQSTLEEYQELALSDYLESRDPQSVLRKTPVKRREAENVVEAKEVEMIDETVVEDLTVFTPGEEVITDSAVSVTDDDGFADFLESVQGAAEEK